MRDGVGGVGWEDAVSVGEEGYNGVGVVVREDATWGGCVCVMPERQAVRCAGGCRITPLGEVCSSHEVDLEYR